MITNRAKAEHNIRYTNNMRSINVISISCIWSLAVESLHYLREKQNILLDYHL